MIRAYSRDEDLRKRFQFHLEWGGSIVGRHAELALMSARDERRFEDLGGTIRWEYDDEPYDGGDCFTDEEIRTKFESNEWSGPYGCIATLGEYEASCWGIVLGQADLNDPYARVMAAEEASQVLYEYDLEQAEAERAARQDIATVQA